MVRALLATCLLLGSLVAPPAGDANHVQEGVTFDSLVGNEWWVAATGGTLATVDVSLDGGAWVALAKQSYGSWAKSLHAAPGSAVEFRARAADGSADVSSAYRWPPG